MRSWVRLTERRRGPPRVRNGHTADPAATQTLRDAAAAREQVATLFGARGREVVFTSGATESIATATWGAVERGPHVVLAA